MQLQRYLEQSARIFPDKTALVCGSQKWTYLEIEILSNRLAHGLIRLGVKRGDRVAICLENSAEAVIAIFGALKADAIFMPVNPTVKSDKLAFVLNNSRACVLLVHGKKLSSIQGALNQAAHLSHVLIEGSLEGPPPDTGKNLLLIKDFLASSLQDEPPPYRSISLDLASLIYTSGSTGVPKGVMVTHLNMTSAAESITTYLENRPEDIILNLLPLSFDYGLYQVLMTFKIGGTLILENSFTYPHIVLSKLAQERCTAFPVVPTMVAIMLQLNLGNYDLSHLRYMTSTGAFFPIQHIQKLRQVLPHVKIYSMYGLTECKRVSYLPPEQLDHRPHSVGKGMPDEEVYIVNEQGERVPQDVLGELVVRGPHVMKGYWEDPQKTAKKLKPGPLPGEQVLYTGDLFTMDEEGYLYFVGRKDDVIKSRGEKVSPKEVENVLYKMGDIVEAAVVGVPDDVLGHAIKAVVVLKEGSPLTEKKILQHCSQHLEDFMIPKYIEIRSSLPKSSSGKIQTLTLKAETTPSVVNQTLKTRPETRIDQWIQKTIERWPEKTAVLYKNRTWTYGDLGRRCDEIRVRLMDSEFHPGERAVLWIENSPEYIAAYLAVLTLGGVVVALHPNVSNDEALQIIRHVEAATLIAAPAAGRNIQPHLDHTELRTLMTDIDTISLSRRIRPSEAPPELAQIIYTSGSTGKPKGVMLSHQNLIANSSVIIQYLNLRREDSVLAALPFSYSYGNSVMLTHLFSGGTLVIENSFLYPKVVMEQMHKAQVTGFSGVASMYALLMNQALFSGSHFPHLRYLTHAGGPMPLPLLGKIRAAFPDKQIFIMYGQTEASARLTYLPPDDLDRKKGSVGHALPGISLKIVDPDGKPCSASDTGEVVVSGPNIMMGYWHDPETTSSVLDQEGWLRTGDMGYLDEDGYLFLMGRNSDIIKSGAFRISPTEIEEVLLQHPGVHEAAVVGVEDLILGEVVVGTVVSKQDPPPGEQELLFFCSKRLAPYKRPRAIYFTKTLPKTPTGKIARLEMRDLVSSLLKSREERTTY